MHMIYFFLILLKTALYYFNVLLIQNLSINNLLFLISIFLYIWLLKRRNSLKKNYYNNFFENRNYTNQADKEALVDHILQYQFKSKGDRYSTFFFLFFSFLCYISLVFSFRFKNISNIIDLKKTYAFLTALYEKMNLLLLIYNFLILFLCIFAIILTLNEIKTLYLKHLMKAHFFFGEEGSWYQKFIDKKAFNNKLYLIDCNLHSHLGTFYSWLFHKMTKEKRTLKHEEYEPKPKVDALYIKYQKFLTASDNIISNIPYNFHYICFFFILLFDLLFNNFVLLHIAYFLPIMFIFHLYVLFCKFALDKRVFGLVEHINKFFYHEVIILDDKWMTIDGIPCYIDHAFPFEFLKFEMKGFRQ